MDDIQEKNRSDPRRRLLRHTYQEGPSFLFLATRGGRPPSGVGGTDVRAAPAGGPAPCGSPAREGIETALALGVGRASLHRWRRRYEVGGLAGLTDRPRGPAPQRLPA